MGNEWAMMVFAALSTLAAGLSTALAYGEWNSLRVTPLVKFALVAFAGLIAGFVFLLLSLGRPQLIMGVLSNPTSSIFPMAMLSASSALLLAVYGLLQYRGAEWRVMRILAALCALSTLGLLTATGSAMMMPWKAAWNTALIPAVFIGYYLTGALLSVQILCRACGREIRTGAGSVALGVLSAVPMLLYMIYLGKNGLAGGFIQFFSQDPHTVIWAAAAIAGIVLPLAVLRRTGSTVLKVAALAVLVTGAAAFHCAVFLIGMPGAEIF